MNPIDPISANLKKMSAHFQPPARTGDLPPEFNNQFALSFNETPPETPPREGPTHEVVHPELGNTTTVTDESSGTKFWKTTFPDGRIRFENIKAHVGTEWKSEAAYKSGSEGRQFGPNPENNFTFKRVENSGTKTETRIYDDGATLTFEQDKEGVQRVHCETTNENNPQDNYDCTRYVNGLRIMKYHQLPAELQQQHERSKNEIGLKPDREAQLRNKFQAIRLQAIRRQAIRLQAIRLQAIRLQSIRLQAIRFQAIRLKHRV